MGMYSSEPATSTTTTSTQYSKEAETRALDLSERQVEMGEEQWALAKEIFAPYEQEMVAYNRAMLPQVQAATEATLNDVMRDIEQGRPIKDALREAMKAETAAQLKIVEAQAAEIQRDIELGRPLKDALRDSAIQDTETMSRVLAGQADEILRDLEAGRPVKDALREATLRQTQAVTPVIEAQAAEILRDIEAGKPLKDALTKAGIAQADEVARDIEAGRPVKDALRDATLRETQARTPAMEQFYKEATKGIDVKERMGLATADVEQAYGTAEGAMRRSAGRMGLTVTANQIKDLALAKVKDIVGARNTARIGAENEQFGRLATAAGMPTSGAGIPQAGSANLPGVASTAAQGVSTPGAGLPWTGSTGVSGATNLPGTVSTATGNVNATGLPGVQSAGGYAVPSVGNYGLTNPATSGAGMVSNVAGNYTSLANRGLSTTTTGTSKAESGGFMDYVAENMATAGTVLAMGASDERLKKDVRKIATIKGVEIVSFKWNSTIMKRLEGEGTKFGVIAQQVMEHYPEVVYATNDLGMDFLSVDYETLADILSGD